ncbi:MAG: hypothetical protein R3Y26_02605 [Rikenellaceae bacterium]
MAIYIYLTLTIIFSLFTTTTYSQNSVYDVISLKNNKGIIKGNITEQVIGSNPTISINVVEASLRYNTNEIIGEAPTKIDVDTESGKVQKDLITLHDNNLRVIGDVYEIAPASWYEIRTSNLETLTIAYEDIEKLSKELIDSQKNIFEECGVLDVLELRNGTSVTGVVIEQQMGKYYTIKDISDNINKVLSPNDIVKITKTGYIPDTDIFQQALYLDEIVKKQGGRFRGIITTQVLGESAIIQFPSNTGNSDPILYSDIEKIIKFPNTYKTIDEKQVTVITEPDSLGWYTKIDSTDSDNVIFKRMNTYRYYFDPERQYIKVTNKSKNEFSNQERYTIFIKVDENSNIEQVIKSIRFWNVNTKVDKKEYMKYIDIQRSFANILPDIVFETEKHGKSTIKLTITSSKAGEYAFTYCENKEVLTFRIK